MAIHFAHLPLLTKTSTTSLLPRSHSATSKSLLDHQPLSRLSYSLRASPRRCFDVITSVAPAGPNFTAEEYYHSGDEEDDGTPWEGAVVYKRDPSVTHLEYYTSLERLGLSKLSSPISRSRAFAMGIRAPAKMGKEQVPDGEESTPVLVSLDVTRRMGRLRLDGIIRTVITLRCNRCAEPVAECVFSNFALLLTKDQIEEPDEMSSQVIYGEDRARSVTEIFANENDEDCDIDADDQLYFPPEEKEIDISKQIRDIVHVEITLNSICSSSCKGLCLTCGTNLNKKTCNCTREKQHVSNEGSNGRFRPLKDLRSQT